MSTKHIIWNQSRGLPTVAHDDLQTALEEAKRLANLQPHDVFEVYSHAATVYGEVKVSVQMNNAPTVPAAPTPEPPPAGIPAGWLRVTEGNVKDGDKVYFTDLKQADVAWGFIGKSVKNDINAEFYRAPVAPTIDLRTCVKGQKLRLRNGEIAEYIEFVANDTYPHKTTHGSRAKNGVYVFNGPDEMDVIEILPLHYPHLRPVPPELLPLPEGAVYLGLGKELVRPVPVFRGWVRQNGRWESAGCLNGSYHYSGYCAPADSEIVRLNREGGK